MSGSSVWRLRSAGVSLVVKQSPRPTESAFYETVAPHLQLKGIGVPELHFSQHGPAEHWIVIEDLPGVLSNDEVRPSEEQVSFLVRLHAATRGARLTLPTQKAAYGWTEPMTADAIACFAADQQPALGRILTRLQARARDLEGEWCWISGDPSPPNWGRRADGSLALFDWELFRTGVPATDLAISIPGLPAPEDFARAAGIYVAEWLRSSDGPLPWNEAELAADMTIAKAWTVVALLSGHRRGRARVPQGYVEDLVAALPNWLASAVPWLAR
jgi:aminoglycoside phosphotransferase (APT) family kinase protein